MRQGCPEGVSGQGLQGSTTKVVPIESFAQDDPYIDLIWTSAVVWGSLKGSRSPKVQPSNPKREGGATLKQVIGAQEDYRSFKDSGRLF